MEKKIYSAPKVKRVDLAVKNAVLDTCHSSTTNAAAGNPDHGGCSFNGCYKPEN